MSSRYEEIRLRLNFNMEDPEQVKLYDWLKQYSSAYERNRALMGALTRAITENIPIVEQAIPDSFFNRIENIFDQKTEQLKKELLNIRNDAAAEQLVMEPVKDKDETLEEINQEETVEIPDELTNYLKSNGFM